MADDLDLLAASLSRVSRLCPEIPLLAIPWMHLKHPIHPVQQELLKGFRAGEPPKPHSGLAHGVLAFGSLFYALYFTVRLFQIRRRHTSIVSSMKSKAFDVLAKSWRFESDGGFGDAEKESREDFYYGDLQQRLSRAGISTLLLYDYPRGKPWNQPSGRQDVESCQLMEWVLTPGGAPLRLAARQWKSSRRLRRMARNGEGLDARVAQEAAWDCLRPRNFRIGLSYWSFKTAIAWWRPKAFLTLYEGHAWERLAWSAAKKVHPSCKTIGYQHTILLPHQLSLLRLSDGSPVTAKPDVVLCLGPKTAEMLQPAHPDSHLIPFGTFRRSARKSTWTPPASKRRTLLVLPEAHAEEMRLMFQTALRAAERLPDHHFIFRCHPILPEPMKQILTHAGKDPRSLSNVELSCGRGIEEDFSRSSALLYRGSSSVLYAVRFGLKPVYLRDSLLPDLDSLFELHTWKEQVSDADQLVDCLRLYAGQNPACLEKEWDVATQFVRSYAIPVEESSVNQLMKALS